MYIFLITNIKNDIKKKKKSLRTLLKFFLKNLNINYNLLINSFNLFIGLSFIFIFIFYSIIIIIIIIFCFLFFCDNTRMNLILQKKGFHFVYYF